MNHFLELTHHQYTYLIKSWIKRIYLKDQFYSKTIELKKQLYKSAMLAGWK